ncbi:pyroglutamyl-peptidase I [Longilinea arvoryzae]|uniref:Pyroglutamyl-peptidase I n=1 Tax=Longilinea arvoryzae TaxID=360412 RepID=A0A0S7BJM0_9CHLR|nr:pyroglutamyl-peptidase I [Longilinea arvoryzae]GAP14803.1 pyroglutamyl-peptidase I [Longilinea arvoryzae]
MKTILVTGFEPFGGSAVNPSQQVASAVNGERMSECRVVSQILPVDRIHGPEALLAAIADYHPDAVLCLGEADRRTSISIERIAINLMDYRIPDNLGEQIQDLPILQDGPAAYFSSLPVREIYAAILAAGIPAELSLSAGAFLCNQVFYMGRHSVARQEIPIPLGFIHLPALPEQVALAPAPFASMSYETSLRAIRLALEVIAKTL